MQLIAAVTQTELLYAAGIAVAFLALIACGELWHRAGAPSVETTRKLVHFGGGIVCLLLPFLIDSQWVVLGLAISMVVLFVVTRRYGFLQSIHGIDRPSRGSEYYPVVVYLLFVLAGDATWKYMICILVLAISDSAAAIIGTRFGKIRFEIEKEYKSLEGSAAFGVATLVLVFVPLLIWNPLADDIRESAPMHLLHYLLASTLIAALVTCFELVSLKGTDNLWVPLGTFLVLTKTMQTDVADLAMQNISFLMVLSMVLLVARISGKLNVGGGLVFCLASYGLWAMGSFDWAVAFFVGFGFYMIAAYASKTKWKMRVGPTLYMLVPPFLVLAAANIGLNMDNKNFYQFCFAPFLAASSVALGQATYNLFAFNHQAHRLRLLLLGVACGCASAALLIGVSLSRQSYWEWKSIVIISVVVVCGLLASAALIRPAEPKTARLSWLRTRAILSMTAALTTGLLCHFLQVDSWKPV